MKRTQPEYMYRYRPADRYKYAEAGIHVTLRRCMDYYYTRMNVNQADTTIFKMVQVCGYMNQATTKLHRFLT